MSVPKLLILYTFSHAPKGTCVAIICLFLALDVEMRKYGFLRVTEIKSEKPSKNTNTLCSRVCHNHLIASYE